SRPRPGPRAGRSLGNRRRCSGPWGSATARPRARSPSPWAAGRRPTRWTWFWQISRRSWSGCGPRRHSRDFWIGPAVKLVLFDVDGTLLSASGAGRRALDRAMRDVYGTSGPIDSYDFRGGTDPQIIRDLLGRAGLYETTIRAGEAAVYQRYAALLEAEVGDGRGVSVFPGVRELVETLVARDDVVVGLLTGNIEPGGRG